MKDFELISPIRQALREDAATSDITSRAIIPYNRIIRARIVAKAPGILAGEKTAALTFTTLDPSLRCRLHLHSGATLARGTTILTVEGHARSIFAAERVALNFLMHLSGIATYTHAFVACTHGTKAKIFDTRKTLPGLRSLEKDAVIAGGGKNHRASLSEAILIKTNHLKTATHNPRLMTHVIAQMIQAAKRRAPKKTIEIEVANLREFTTALHAQPDIILLDNWPLRSIRQAVRLRTPGIALEVSGGVTLKNVRAIAKTGVDRISIGRVTHSAPSLDLALQVV